MNKLKRRLFYSALVMLGIGLLPISCQKAEKMEALTSITSKSLDYHLDNIPIIQNKQDIQRLLLNSEDKDDEKINNYLYELSLASRELIKNHDFNNTIIELAKQSENQSANLLDLEKVAPQFYNIINFNLNKKGLSLKFIANELTHQPSNPNPEIPVTTIVEKYVPSIFIPNLEIADPNKQPLISPNIEVDCTNDESIEDHIIAWYYNENGGMEEILLNEETSLKTTNPLLLLDNACPNIKKNTVEIQNPEENTTSTTSFSSYEYSIENGYGYESWAGGKSEFCVVAYRIDPDGDVHWIYDSYGWKTIARVKRGDIGKLLLKWSHHASNWLPYSANRVYWNTYERDWNRSKKHLGTATANGTTIYLYGRRKYNEEWYAWEPSTLQIHYTRFEWIMADWAHWNNSWKSRFRLWRVEI